MFIPRVRKPNRAMKLTIIRPRKGAHTIGLSRLKGFKSTQIGRMALQSREEGFNKGVSVGLFGKVK